jgi:hypothetical protein
VPNLSLEHYDLAIASAMLFALGQLLVDYMPASEAFETLKTMAAQTGPIMEQLEADAETIH